jgi:hypothetical protein
LAAARLPLLEQLKMVPRAAPIEAQRRQVLAIWNPALLDDCPAAAPWRDLYDGVRATRQQWDQLQKALDAEDLPAAERLLKRPDFDARDLPVELAARLEELRSRSQQSVAASRQAIINTLLAPNRAAFGQLFDAALVGDICQQFRHHQPIVRQWVENDILPADRIGFAADPESAVTRDDEGNLQLRWTWPAARISDQCRLVISKTRPGLHALPEDVPALYSATLDRNQWDEQSGHIVPLDPGWEGSRVFVWAVIELGFQTFYSEPFEVGVIEPIEARPRRWGLFRGWRSEKTAAETTSDPPPAADSSSGPAAAEDQTPPGEQGAGEAPGPAGQGE